jgi:P27 family predicted phage terminase small subunit
MTKTPKHLSTQAKADWKRFHNDYRLDSDCEDVLLEMLEAMDRKREAQAALKADGITIKNRFNELRPHPACGIERDMRLQILRCLKVIGLPLSEDKDKRKPGRPPATYPVYEGGGNRA